MKGLKLEPGWRQACGDMVELVLAEVEAADQRADRAGARVQRHQRALDLGQLGQRPARPWRPAPARTTAPRPDLHLRAGLVRQARRHRPQAVAGDGDRLARLQHRHHLARRGLQHHGGAQFVVVGMLGQRLGDARVERGRVGRQVDEGLGPAVELALLVVQQAAAQRPVGGLLRRRVDRQRARSGRACRSRRRTARRPAGAPSRPRTRRAPALARGAR